MAKTTINGIPTTYEVRGSGPPLLMLAPGGFDSRIDKWWTAGVWQQVLPLDTFSDRFTCIAYDRRESGASGGRIEKLTWEIYADEAKSLLDHLGLDSAFVMGGCMGCSVAIAFGVRYPAATRGLVLHWPVGGAEWIEITHERWLGVHAGFVREQGLAAAVEVAREKGSFMADFRAGPWASVIAQDPAFAATFAAQDVDAYLKLVAETTRVLYDRDTAPGAEPEELERLNVPALVIPGDDPFHATSAAVYLAKHLPRAEYWDVKIPDQTGEAVRSVILDFLAKHSAG